MKFKRILAFLLFSLCFSLGIFFSAFELWELSGYDLALKLRSKINPYDTKKLPLVFIAIDDQTLAHKGIKQFPIPRRYYAQAVYALKQLGAKEIVFDIIFAEHSDQSDDMALFEAMQRAGNVFLPYSISQDARGNVRKVSITQPFVSVAKYTGYITSAPDIDGKRRFLPVRRRIGGRYFYHLSLISSLAYLDLNPYASVKNLADKIIVSKLTKRGILKIVMPLYRGDRLYLDYPGTWEQCFKKISFISLLEIYSRVSKGKPLTEEQKKAVSQIKGAICVIGLTATGTHDLAPTPLENMAPMVETYGVVFGSILSQRFIYRMNPFPTIFVFLLLGLLALNKKFQLERFWLVYVLAVSVWIIFAIGLFVSAGIWVPFVAPVVGSVILAFWTSWEKYLTNLRERQRVEQEMQLASSIQRQMLPEKLPKGKGISIEAYFSPAIFVAGDFYDAWKGKESLRLLMGDVSGKGVSAALYVAQIITAERVLRPRYENKGVEELLEDINRFLARYKISGVYATGCIVEIKKDLLVISDAGHLAVWVYRKSQGDIEEIKMNTGAPLGVDRWSEYKAKEIVWEEGDVFMVFSDGMLEARNDKGFVSEEELKQWIRANIDRPMCAIDEFMSNFYGEQEQSDDITLIVVRNVFDEQQDDRTDSKGHEGNT